MFAPEDHQEEIYLPLKPHPHPTTPDPSQCVLPSMYAKWKVSMCLVSNSVEKKVEQLVSGAQHSSTEVPSQLFSETVVLSALK